MWALIFMAVASAYSAYSSQQAGKAQKLMNAYNANVAKQQQLLNLKTLRENQALLARSQKQNIELVNIQAKGDTRDLQKRYMLLAGAQKVAHAANRAGGGSVTEGDIATDTFNTLKDDENTIRYNADLSIWKINEGAGIEAWTMQRDTGLQNWGLEREAEGYTQAGKYAQQAGNREAIGTILQTASSMSNAYSNNYSPKAKTQSAFKTTYANGRTY